MCRRSCSRVFFGERMREVLLQTCCLARFLQCPPLVALRWDMGLGGPLAWSLQAVGQGEEEEKGACCLQVTSSLDY